jgi:uncharacterized protein
MKKIGLLSDTHGDLPENVFGYFSDVDEIWHAGDIGSTDVTDSLKGFKPLRAVYGNIDDHVIRQEFPEFEIFETEGLKVLITHIGGKPGRYSKPAREALLREKPGLFVCGHSHILLVQFDRQMNMLCMNPGACGNKGFHKMRTLLRFGIENGKVVNVEAIELGKRAG